MKKPTARKTNFKRTHIGLRPISRLAQSIGRKSFKKQGFNGIEIFKQWEYIVGVNLAQYCMPEKINWPRQNKSKLDAQTGETSVNGATMVVRCLGAFALEIESQAPTIIQRANVMFGYAAINKIKLKQVQHIDFTEKHTPQKAPPLPDKVDKTTGSIKNEKLRDALNALGAQIYKDK